MAVKVRIPTPLRNLTGGKDEVEVEGSNVREVLENLEKAYPGFRERLFDENGNLRRFVNLFLNDEDIRFLKELHTEIKDGDVLSIIPAIAGGGERVKKKIYLTYPPELVKEPILWRASRKFDIITNIRSASVKKGIGLVALEIEGEREEVENALKWFEEQGIKVEPIEQDVVEG